MIGNEAALAHFFMRAILGCPPSYEVRKDIAGFRSDVQPGSLCDCRQWTQNGRVSSRGKCSGSLAHGFVKDNVLLESKRL